VLTEWHRLCQPVGRSAGWSVNRRAIRPSAWTARMLRNLNQKKRADPLYFCEKWCTFGVDEGR
jgi:hypothetical protein